ncbi:MAG: PKD domain-containing protein, partial [Candidatus Thermoplasmatota archaeon]|nr:PKD domain-containing protein [Candidatus Thermoplasmatota archaeon]
MEWKYGQSGAVISSYMGVRGRTVYTDRYPAAGTTTSTLSKYYYAPTGSVVGRVTLRVYAEDHTGLHVRLRGYSPTQGNVYIYYQTNTNDGIKADLDVTSYRFTQLWVYYYDASWSASYYNFTWSTVDMDILGQVDGPGYSTWVYYRMRGTDHFGYSTTSPWYRYWADGDKPTMFAHKSPSVKEVTDNVNLEATFGDESRIESGQLFYSYEGSSFTMVNMTPGFHNGTHMGASAMIPKTDIPMNVTYYFRFFDAAGNNNTSSLYTYTTIMHHMVEGTFYDFDSSVIEADAGFLKWEWDFHYDGTFNSDRTGQMVRYRYHDNGTYTVMLRMTDKDWAVTYLSFTVIVDDLTPTADFYNVGTMAEGTTLSLDASYSQSFPDEIVSYEWDVDYDGLTFKTAGTGIIYNHTFGTNGLFTIALRVIDDDGSVDIISKDLTVTDAVPDVKLDYLAVIDEGVQMTFNATGTVSYPDGLARIEWDLDYDGIFVSDFTGLLVNHTYMDDGVYRFAVRAYDDDGSMTQSIRTVTVNDIAPVAIINAAASVDEGTSYDLNGNASTSFPDDLVSHEWDFHFDGTFDVEATGDTASFIYMDDNVYTIALRVWDDDGSATIATMDVTVVDRKPVAEIIAATIVDEGTLVEVTSNIISFPDEMVDVDWDFYYDGINFTRDALGDEAEHTYMDHGIYTIAIRVNDDDGSVTIETLDIEVRDLSPLANATISGDFVEGKVLIIDGRPSSSYPDRIVSWEWDVDYDGETFDTEKTGDVVEHTYNDHGTYTIALRVTDDDGSEHLNHWTFTITDRGPIATITVAVMFHSEGSLVTF